MPVLIYNIFVAFDFSSLLDLQSYLHTLHIHLVYFSPVLKKKDQYFLNAWILNAWITEFHRRKHNIFPITEDKILQVFIDQKLLT